MLTRFAPSSSLFQGQREDLHEALKVDFLAVASLSYWVGVGKSSRFVGRASSWPAWGASSLYASSWLYGRASLLLLGAHEFAPCLWCELAFSELT